MAETGTKSLIQDIAAGAEQYAREMAEDLTGAFNAITNIYEADCNGDLFLYIETALPALGEAVLVLFKPSPGEILEEYLQPKPGRGFSRRGGGDDRRRKRGRNGHSRLTWRTLIPDVDQAIADRIPGAETIQGRKIGPAQYIFFKSIQELDRVGLWAMLIDVVDDFAVKWQSGLMDSRFCDFIAPIVLQAAPQPGAASQIVFWRSPDEANASVTKSLTLSNQGDMAFSEDGVNLALANVQFEARYSLGWTSAYNLTVDKQVRFIATGYDNGNIVQQVFGDYVDVRIEPFVCTQVEFDVSGAINNVDVLQFYIDVQPDTSIIAINPCAPSGSTCNVIGQFV